VPSYVSLVAQGRYAEALEVHRRRNPFALACGRVCPAFCEIKCRRVELDQPVAIRQIKRFMADHEIEQPWMPPQLDIAWLSGRGACAQTGGCCRRLPGRPVVYWSLGRLCRLRACRRWSRDQDRPRGQAGHGRSLAGGQGDGGYRQGARHPCRQYPHFPPAATTTCRRRTT